MSTLTIHDISQAIHDDAIADIKEVAERYNLKVVVGDTTLTVELPEVE